MMERSFPALFPRPFDRVYQTTVKMLRRIFTRIRLKVLAATKPIAATFVIVATINYVAANSVAADTYISCSEWIFHHNFRFYTRLQKFLFLINKIKVCG